MSLNNRMKEVRINEDLSLAKFGAKIGEPKSKIYNIESGRQKAPGYILQKIVVKFHVNAHWLLTGEGEMYTNQDKKQEKLPAALEPIQPLPQEKIIKNHKKSCIQAFIDQWFAEESMDNQMWLELQLRRSIPEYKEFVSSKEIAGELLKKQAGE